MIRVSAHIQPLDRSDIPEIADAFEELGWNKPVTQYEHYLMEQIQGLRVMYVARADGTFAGYITICWQSHYGPFRDGNIPEIVDFNVLPKFRRLGIGTQLMDMAEAEIAKAVSTAGIGVGMTPDYGAAQRLYVLRGYVPDGNGLSYLGRPVRHSQAIKADDNLVLYLIKELR